MSIANIIALTVATMSLIICFVNYFSSVGTKYKKYKKFVEYIRNGYDYDYGTYEDFLKEFEDRDMRNKEYDKSGFYDYGDFTITKCTTSGMIRFDNFCMILSYKDYKKYKKFIEKELKLRKDYELNKHKVKKWGR